MQYLNEFIGRLYSKFQIYIYDTYVVNIDELLKNIGIALLVLSLIWGIEIYLVGWQKSGMRRIILDRSASTVNDIIFFFIHISGAIILLSWILTLGVPVIFRAGVREFVDLKLGAMMGGVTHLLLYLIVLDFFNYWQHRLLHRIPALWHIHSFHHSATEFNTITVFREHPLDKGFNTIMSIIPAVIVGVPAEDYPLFMIVYGIIGYLKHNQIPWRMGFFGKYIIQSPLDHWIHHSTDKEHYDKNFANVFAIWDHIFGTYYGSDKINSEIGLPGDDYNNNDPVGDFFRPQIRFIKALFGRN